MSVGPAGFVIAGRGERGACEVRLYAPAGELIAAHNLPQVRRPWQAFRTGDGGLLVYGELEGNFDYDLEVAGWKKQDAMPRGLLRLADPTTSSETELLFKGVDAVVPDGDRLWAYARDLYAPENALLIRHGFTFGSMRQVLFRLSPAGKIEETFDVSDAAVGVSAVQMDSPLGGRFLFFLPGSGRIVDLHPAKGTRL